MKNNQILNQKTSRRSFIKKSSLGLGSLVISINFPNKSLGGQSAPPSLKPNACKIALKALSDVLVQKSYHFIDCQVPTQHLQRMGARLISRDQFLDELEVALSSGGDDGKKWDYIKWEYSDG